MIKIRVPFGEKFETAEKEKIIFSGGLLGKWFMNNSIKSPLTNCVCSPKPLSPSPHRKSFFKTIFIVQKLTFPAG